MQITICRADCAGNARNCRYPTKVVVADAGMMKDAVAYDHVCGEYKGSYRTNGNFLSSDVVVMDLDNDHPWHGVKVGANSDKPTVFSGLFSGEEKSVQKQKSCP